MVGMAGEVEGGAQGRIMQGWNVPCAEHLPKGKTLEHFAQHLVILK